MGDDLITSQAHTAVLVEGESDRGAVLALGRRLGRDLASEGVLVVSMGGATNIRRYVRRFGPAGMNVRLTGLCDAGEAGYFVAALEEAGHEVEVEDLESVGFFVCVTDLEDELIRILGPDRVVGFIEAQGELRTFRLMQRQPAQRGRTLEEQLHRFSGIRSGRKLRYAEGLIGELDLDNLPRPLDGLMRFI